MAKLHEVLAVEGDLDGTFKKLQDETKKIFGKPSMFIGMHKSCRMFDAEDTAPPDEFQEMVTTVQDKLDYLAEAGVKYYNAVYQKDVTNTVARADVVLPDGTVLLENMPATFLLGLENKLKKLREVYEAIPTLQQGQAWKERDDLGKNIFGTVNSDRKLKTAKKFKYQVLYEATDKHPAQIEKWEEQVPVGEFKMDVTSGMVTPARKSELIGKLDALIQATKKARQRANATKLDTTRIADIVFHYINA